MDVHSKWITTVPLMKHIKEGRLSYENNVQHKHAQSTRQNAQLNRDRTENSDLNVCSTGHFQVGVVFFSDFWAQLNAASDCTWAGHQGLNRSFLTGLELKVTLSSDCNRIAAYLSRGWSELADCQWWWDVQRSVVSIWLAADGAAAQSFPVQPNKKTRQMRQRLSETVCNCKYLHVNAWRSANSNPSPLFFSEPGEKKCDSDLETAFWSWWGGEHMVCPILGPHEDPLDVRF